MLTAHLTSAWLREYLRQRGGVLTLSKRVVIAG
jgi:hypothetical protein